MAKKEFNKKVFAGKLVVIILLGLVLGISCFFSSSIEKFLGIGDKEEAFVNSEVIAESDLSVHYIDVGQGDSTLICLPDETTMLIDAGTASSATHIVSYIKNLGIEMIDYFILTHADADHVGGAVKVLEEFEIKTIFRPFQISLNSDGSPSEYERLGEYITLPNVVTSSTATYRRTLEAVYKETYTENGATYNSEVWVAYDGLTINSIKSSATFNFEFFGPFIYSSTPFSSSTQTTGYPTHYSSSNESNDASPVMLLEYGTSSFLFIGDACKEVETEVLNSLTPAEKERFKNIDVFSAGHHGSRYSNGEEFLNITTPNYVVVSCGEGNSYGHPHQEFLDIVNSYTHTASDYLLRTDKLGDIVFGFTTEGTLAYTANSSGDGGVTVYWWHIALGTFIVLTIVVISVKVTTNKTATAKRAVSKTKKVVNKLKK